MDGEKKTLMLKLKSTKQENKSLNDHILYAMVNIVVNGVTRFVHEILNCRRILFNMLLIHKFKKSTKVSVYYKAQAYESGLFLSEFHSLYVTFVVFL
jgi:hypothetical protein